MKKTLILFLAAIVAALGIYTITAQNRVPAEKISVKSTSDGVKITEKEVKLSHEKAILGHWSLLGFVADGIPPKTFMGGEQFPKGTVFTFGRNGRGVTSYKGKRISNFDYRVDGDRLMIKYVVLEPNSSITAMEKDRYRILELNAADMIIGTSWEEELVGKLHQQREIKKIKMDFSTHLILAFARK